MGAKNYRGVYVPTAGEDILAGTTALAQSLGVITRVASIAVARQIVAANRETVTSANPMYFEINGLLYVHDGGAFKPVNEAETSFTRYGQTWEGVVKQTVFTPLLRADIGARPYDRAYTAVGNCVGRVVKGYPFLCISVDHQTMSLAKFPSSGSNEFATVVDAGVIRAGSEPVIELGFYGGRGDTDGQLRVPADLRMNRLVVTTTPITMR